MSRSIAVVVGVAIAIFIGALCFYSAGVKETSNVNTVRILAAVKTFANDCKAQGIPVPPSVSLRELLSRKLLNDSDVTGFQTRDVVINLPLEDTRPEAVLMQARMQDGRQVVLLADGSVHIAEKDLVR